jgi:hypothetical protein
VSPFTFRQCSRGRAASWQEQQHWRDRASCRLAAMINHPPGRCRQVVPTSISLPLSPSLPLTQHQLSSTQPFRVCHLLWPSTRPESPTATSRQVRKARDALEREAHTGMRGPEERREPSRPFSAPVISLPLLILRTNFCISEADRCLARWEEMKAALFPTSHSLPHSAGSGGRAQLFTAPQQVFTIPPGEGKE